MTIEELEKQKNEAKELYTETKKQRDKLNDELLKLRDIYPDIEGKPTIKYRGYNND